MVEMKPVMFEKKPVIHTFIRGVRVCDSAGVESKRLHNFLAKGPG
jgi:hypothetical protein